MFILIRTGAALATVACLAGCGIATSSGGTITSTTTAPAEATPAAAHLNRAEARAARAVKVLSQALQTRSVARLCRPGVVFTPAVVAQLNVSQSCEAALESSSTLSRPPALTVVGLSYEPGLALAQVRVGTATTIPLYLVREGRRWLVSFSDGADPISALEE